MVLLPFPLLIPRYNFIYLVLGTKTGNTPIHKKWKVKSANPKIISQKQHLNVSS